MRSRASASQRNARRLAGLAAGLLLGLVMLGGGRLALAGERAPASSSSGRFDLEPSGSPALPPAALQVEHPGGTIAITGVPPAGGLALMLARTAEQAAGELPGRLGLALPRQVMVVYCADAATFARVAARPATEHLLGVARPAAGIVALNGVLLGPGPEDNAGLTLRHELAHLAVGTVEEAAGPIPRWFDEGAASWFAGSFAELGPLDLTPAITRPSLRLSQLAFGFPEDLDGRRIAYAKSLLAVQLLERRAPAGMAAMGKALTAGIAFPEALHEVAGLDEATMDALLAQETAPHGLLLAVLRRSLSPVLIMTGLALVGFFVRRLRVRRRLREWARAEATELETARGRGVGVGGAAAGEDESSGEGKARPAGRVD